MSADNVNIFNLAGSSWLSVYILTTVLWILWTWTFYTFIINREVCIFRCSHSLKEWVICSKTDFLRNKSITSESLNHSLNQYTQRTSNITFIVVLLYHHRACNLYCVSNVQGNCFFTVGHRMQLIFSQRILFWWGFSTTIILYLINLHVAQFWRWMPT